MVKDINMICEQFVSISFVTIPLRCNFVALGLASIAKKNEEAIIWSSFLFPTV